MPHPNAAPEGKADGRPSIDDRQAVQGAARRRPLPPRDPAPRYEARLYAPGRQLLEISSAATLLEALLTLQRLLPTGGPCRGQDVDEQRLFGAIYRRQGDATAGTLSPLYFHQ